MKQQALKHLTQTYIGLPEWHYKSVDMCQYMYNVIYPSLKRMAQIRFGESSSKFDYTADYQADIMLRHTVGLVFDPGRVFTKYLIADMLFRYIATGAVDIKFNIIHQLDRMYYSESSKPLSVRPDRLLEYK